MLLGLHYPPHFDFGKSKKKKNLQVSVNANWTDMTKIVPYIVQWSFKMFKIELNSHYLDFWTQIYNFLVVWVIYTNYASNVMLIFYILG